MDQDDPENRAEQSSPVEHPVVDRAQVRGTAFSKPPRGKRGYNEDEVDAFLDLVEAARRDATGRTLTPEQVRNVAFSKPPIGKRGYNEDEVDAFLDLVEQEMTRRAGGADQGSRQEAFPPAPGPPPQRTERQPFASVGRMVAALFFAVLSVWLIGLGVHNLWAQHSGGHARVELLQCWRTTHPSPTHSNLSLLFSTYDCAGRLADGTEQIVTVHGVTKRPSPMITQTVDVRVHGDQAYTNSLRLPVPDLLLGSLVLAVVLWAVLPQRPSRASRRERHARHR